MSDNKKTTMLDLSGSPEFNSIAAADALNTVKNRQKSNKDIRDTLDWAGLLSGPLEPIGIGADVLSGILSLAKGDYERAGMSGIGAVPGLGVLAGTGKLFRKTRYELPKYEREHVSAGFAKRNPDLAEPYRGGKAFWVTADANQLKNINPSDAEEALSAIKAQKRNTKLMPEIQDFKERMGPGELKQIYKEIDNQYAPAIKLLNDIIKAR